MNDPVCFTYAAAFLERHAGWENRLKGVGNIMEVIIAKQHMGTIGAEKWSFNLELTWFRNVWGCLPSIQVLSCDRHSSKQPHIACYPKTSKRRRRETTVRCRRRFKNFKEFLKLFRRHIPHKIRYLHRLRYTATGGKVYGYGIIGIQIQDER
jgi:hypothetical protein